MGQSNVKVLLVEDHVYFASEIREYLEDDCGFAVTYITNYEDAQRALKKKGPFHLSFLDILLQNGKTGVDLVERYKEKLGRIMFVTGCVDETILNKIRDYASVSKLQEIWPELDRFIEGSTPKIRDHDTVRLTKSGKLQYAE